MDNKNHRLSIYLKWLRPFRQGLSYYSLPILTGLFVGTSYIPFPPWAAFFCLIPLWIFLMQAPSLKVAVIGAWISQFVFTLIGFNWVAHTLHEFGHIPWLLAIPLTLVFASFANLHFPLAAGFWFWISQKLNGRKFPITKTLQVLWLPLFFCLAEWTYPMIFEWHMGYPFLWMHWPIFHVAEWVGFRGLSLFVIFMNLAIWLSWQQSSSYKKAAALTGCLLVFLALNVLGLVLKSRLPSPDAQIDALVIQANVGNLEKQYAVDGWNFKESIIQKHFLLMEKNLSLQVPDVVIWPETAYPEEVLYPYGVSSLMAPIRALLRQKNTHLLAGSYGQDLSSGKTTNSVLFMDSTGRLVQTPYNKTVLLAFGEFLPFGNWFPQLKKWVPQVGDFARGNGPEMKSFAGVNWGVQICYEGLFDDFTRNLAQQQAEVLVNLTNDSWYGRWQEPYQHLYMTLARAIEVRRPLIRSTNTGISTAILANGELLPTSPLHEPWAGFVSIPYKRITTPDTAETYFVRGGIYFTPVFLLLWLLFTLGWAVKSRRSLSLQSSASKK